MEFEIKLNLERLALEKQYRENNPQNPSQQFYHLKNNKGWYNYYIKKWTSSDMSPEEVYQYGLDEVERIVHEYRKIQEQLGYKDRNEAFYELLNGPRSLITQRSELVNQLNMRRALAKNNLRKLFEDTFIPDIEIKPIPEATKDSPPGYYDQNVFYYNFFADRFRARNLDWLYIHEAVPGHHFESAISAKNKYPFTNHFYYPGFEEGWAAYVETIGKEMGFYQDPYQQLGKWEWDMVRSIRLPMDVGLNYLGWTKQQAIDFWKKFIPNQDEIAVREIDRLLRWPVQVMSYKLGERTILKLKADCQQKLGEKFNIKRFHSKILGKGAIPLPILKKNFDC